MEKKLKKMFDYQRFEKNERLEKLILETESRYAAELSDDDLSIVCAAGESENGAVKKSVIQIKSNTEGIFTHENKRRTEPNKRGIQGSYR